MLQSTSGAETSARIKRIGVLRADTVFDGWIEAFRKTLDALGYVEGSNVAYDYRLASAADMPQAARDMFRSGVDLVVAGGTPAALAAKQASVTVPIVFMSADPVETGLVASLARPGANITGIGTLAPELGVKRLELLRKIVLQLLHAVVPQAKRLGYLRNPRNPAQEIALKELQRSSKQLGLTLQELTAGDSTELGVVPASLPARRLDAIYISGDNLFFKERAKVAKAVREAKLPAVFPYAEWHDAGVLMSYGPSAKEMMRRMASFVDKILKGARPAELPVEQISQFDSVIDLRVARAMGIRVPEDVLLHADEVIR